MRAPILTQKRARTQRRKMTLPEVLLWGELRNGRLQGLRFRRQHPIGPKILEVYLPSHRPALRSRQPWPAAGKERTDAGRRRDLVSDIGH